MTKNREDEWKMNLGKIMAKFGIRTKKGAKPFA
jgi:hypothetical protein